MTRIFSRLYDRVLIWARHPRAPWYLGGLSFAESSFFPIPPDVMLAPMVLARPQRAWFLASLTTVTSVIGGIAGFAIGMVAMEWVQPWLDKFGYMDEFNWRSFGYEARITKGDSVVVHEFKDRPPWRRGNLSKPSVVRVTRFK